MAAELRYSRVCSVLALMAMMALWCAPATAQDSGDFIDGPPTSGARGQSDDGGAAFEQDMERASLRIAERKEALATEGNDRVHVLFLIDVSGSMKNWWARVPDAAYTIAGNLEDGDLVSVYTFDDHLERRLNMEEIDGNLAEIKGEIPTQMSDVQGTNVRWAMHETLKDLRDFHEELRADRSRRPVAEQFLVVISDRFNDPPSRSSDYFDEYLDYNSLSSDRNAPPEGNTARYDALVSLVDSLLHANGETWLQIMGIGVELQDGLPVFIQTEAQRVEVTPTQMTVTIEPGKQPQSVRFSAVAYNVHGKQLDRDFNWKLAWPDPDEPGVPGQDPPGQIDSSGVYTPGIIPVPVGSGCVESTQGRARIQVQAMPTEEPVVGSAFVTIVRTKLTTWGRIKRLLSGSGLKLLLLILVLALVVAAVRYGGGLRNAVGGAIGGIIPSKVAPLDVHLDIFTDDRGEREADVTLEDGEAIAVGADPKGQCSTRIGVEGAKSMLAAIIHREGKLELKYRKDSSLLINEAKPTEESPATLKSGDRIQITIEDEAGDRHQCQIDVTF